MDRMAATSYEAAVNRKKDAVNTPSKIQFFKKGSGGFDYLKTAAWLEGV